MPWLGRCWSLLSSSLLGALVLGSGGCASESQPPADGGTTPADVDYLTEERLAAIASHLSAPELEGRNEGTAGHEAARAYVIEQLRACGVQPAVGESFEQPITTGGGVNVLGRIAGTSGELGERYLVVGAHYDHLGVVGGEVHPGAGDNAAAVAIMIGVACELTEHPTARSVLVASWDSEEPPTYLTDAMGSEFYAANPTVPLDRIDVNLTLDLVGLDMWPGFQGHVVCGGELSPEVAAQLDAAVVPEGLLARRGGLHLVQELVTGGTMVWSDYAAFLSRGRPALFFSDGQNKNYHQPSDTFATLDVPKMRREALYLHDVVVRLGTSTAIPTFDAAGSNYPLDAAMALEMLDWALAPSTGIVAQLGLSATSRSDLEADRTAVAEVKAALDGGAQPTAGQIETLRRGVQRLMCLAGSSYGEATCHLM